MKGSIRRGSSRAPSISVFFGGAIDHAILALKRSDRTPYGVAAGVGGNWLLAALDLALAGTMYALHRRL
jgi:hypothetical protein